MNTHLMLEIDSLSGPILFKPFLEESNIIFDIETIDAPIIPVFMNNPTTHTRTLQKATISFSVFPESREECILNYKKLKKLLNAIKPVYGTKGLQLIPHKTLFEGFITIKFSGLFPGKNKTKLKLNTFSYEINKELGYIQVSVDEIGSGGSGGRGNKMIPVGYNIKLDGDIMQKFSDTVNIG